MKLCIATSLILLAAAIPATAQANLRVCLTSGQEIPPLVIPALGNGNVLADQVMNMVTITGTYGNLTSNVTSVDLYLGDPFTNSNTILMTLTSTGGTSGTFSGQSVLSDAHADDVYWGRSYINIRTTANPGGEIRGQVAQRMSLDCPSEFPTDPVLADIAGDPLYGPKIGHSLEAFNVSLDCSNAPAPGMFLIVLKTQKAFPAFTPRGIVWVQGPRLLGSTGVHAQDTVQFAPASIILPPDIYLVGRQYMVQGFCGGRLSNGILEVVGIGH